MTYLDTPVVPVHTSFMSDDAEIIRELEKIVGREIVEVESNYLRTTSYTINKEKRVTGLMLTECNIVKLDSIVSLLV